MARLMAIATHHKGGTVWIKRVIRAISRRIDVPWIGLWSERQSGSIPKSGRAFLCNWAGWFPAALWERDDMAALHVVRDPRDILLSGCDYHLVAGIKGERFLHTPRADLDGKTYQQHLLSLADRDSRLLFEMGNKHAETLAEMRNWPWGDPRISELRYEDLMRDTNAVRFGEALGALGLDESERREGEQAFWENSLFGGLADPATRKGRLPVHVSSGGRLQRWRRELPRHIGRIYETRFGADLRALGYETDGSWVGSLPERAAA